MYTYYKPISTSNYYWPADQLAQLRAIYTTTGKPHSRFVVALMDNYFKENDKIFDFYRKSKEGLIRVFPEEDFYVAISPFESIKKNKVQIVSVGGKTYKVIFKQWD